MAGLPPQRVADLDGVVVRIGAGTRAVDRDAALGVLLGGVLTAGLGWRWVLFINVPIALLLVLGLRTRLPAQPSPYARGRLDLLGAALVTAATGTLIYALIRAGDRGWATTTTVALIGMAALLYGAFALRQRLSATALMNPRLLVRRPVATGTLLILVATALMITVFFLGSFYFQSHQGYGALHTGLLFLPVAVATMIGANVAGRHIGAVGSRTLGSIGLLVAALGMAIPALAEGTLAVATGVSIVGAGAGIVFVVASAAALGRSTRRKPGWLRGSLARSTSSGPRSVRRSCRALPQPASRARPMTALFAASRLARPSPSPLRRLRSWSPPGVRERRTATLRRPMVASLTRRAPSVRFAERRRRVIR